MQKMTFLGTFSGTSKSNGRPFYMAYLYGEEANTLGFRAYTFFVDQDMYSRLKAITPLKALNVDARFIKGTNVLVDFKE